MAVVEPLFVVGCARSGTSVLKKILQADPGVSFAPETHFLYQAQAHVVGIADEAARMPVLWARYRNDPHFTRLELTDRQLARLGAQTTTRGFFTELMRSWQEKTSSEVLAEKTPANFRYIRQLFDWYPDARFFFAVRDPRSVVASMLALERVWSPKLLVDAARLWNEAAAAALAWRADPRVLVVPYEPLMADVPGTAVRLYEHMGRTFDSRWLDREAAVEQLEPASAGGNGSLSAHGGISADRVAAWRDRLDARQVAQVEHLCRVGMEALGYRPEGVTGAAVAARAVVSRAGSVTRRAVRAARSPRQAITRLAARRD